MILRPKRVPVPCILVGVIYLLTLAPPSVGWSQDSQEQVDAEAEITEVVSFTAGPRVQVDRGERFELSVFVTRDDPETVRLSFPPLPNGFRQPESPVVVTRGQRDMEIRIPLSVNVPGRFVLEAIRISSFSNVRETEPILIEVRDPQRDVVPFQARWRIDEERVHEGQSFPVFLEIVGIDTFAFPEIVHLRSPETGLFDEVSGVGSVASREIAGTILYEIPVAAFVFTPTSIGSITIPAATIEATGIQVQAPALEIDVAPLPDEVRSSGAVGRLELEVLMESDELMPGETGDVTIRISGTGNLPVLEFPAVELDGLVEVGRSRRSSVTPDREEMSGYRGNRELTVRFEAEGGVDRGSVSVGAFSVFDPERSTVQTISKQTRAKRIIASDVEASLEDVAPEADLIPVSELTRIAWIPFSEIPWVYSFFALGPLALAVARLWSVRGAATFVALPFMVGATLFPRIDVERLQLAQDIIAEDRPAVAAVLYELEVQENEWHAGLHFNRGVLALRVNDPIDAVYHLRRAVRLAPERGRFRTVLADAEDYFDTDKRLVVPWYVRPDAFVVAMWLAWTIFWLLLSFQGRLRRTIALTALLMIGLVLVGGWWWSGNRARESEAIVVRSVTVRRIPSLTAQPWIQVDSTTAVRVELSYEDFYLIRTATGLQGWVPRASLWILGEH